MVGRPLVGIVVVSHSHALAAAAVALAREMAGPEVPIAIAAGLDESTFGTDATRIADALSTVDSPAGTVVLMDLGSAVLSADLALEMVDPEVRDRVLLCPAPLVEGLIAAAVTAAGNADRETVAAEARSALSAKQSQLGTAAPAQPAPQAGDNQAPAEPAAEDVPPPAAGEPRPGDLAGAAGAEQQPVSVPRDAPTGAGDVERATGVFVVANPDGLHARPAARLVRETRDLPAEVTLRNLRTGAGPAAAGSLSRLTTLGARYGDRIEVTATGAGAQAAVDAVLALAAARFGEPEPVDDPRRSASSPAADPPGPTAVAAPDADADAGTVLGVVDVRSAAGRTGPLPVAAGIAIGPLWTVRVPALELPPVTEAVDPAAERARLAGALDAARAELAAARDRSTGAAAGILDAHLLLLDDPALLGDAGARIGGGVPAEHAWVAAVDAVAGELAGLDDAYLAERAGDARAVRDQVLAALVGAPPATAVGEGPAGGGVLVVPDLTPAQAADLDPATVRGLVLALAGPTAHSAIVAAGLGIPTVAGAGASVLDVPPGTTIALDGGTGELAIDPDDATLARLRRRAAQYEQRTAAARARAGEPAVTTDGVHIEVAANVGSVADAVAANAAGADAVGLVRTEFLFLDRTGAPDVAEQEAAYRGIAAALGGKRITLRTLDVGGDKPLPYLPLPPEANPFLGIRGLRLALTRPDLLRDQLRAMVRVARDAPVTVLLPMVSAVAELTAARAALDDAIRTEAAGNRPPSLRLGMMIEVPAAALKAPAFLPYVDMFSVGTNDLTQYTLAAERGNAAVAGLADPLDPAVLALIDRVCRAARDRVPVAVCGESAADGLAARLLIGLGVRELSVAPAAVARTKATVRETSAQAARTAAETALAAPDAQAVRAQAQR